VLALTFIFQLGTVLDTKPKPNSPEQAIGRAFSAMAKTSLGGAILLFAAVIVLTTLTQAFVFEAIHLLEGHWGTLSAVERIAKRRCTHFRNKAEGLQKRYDDLTKKAWAKARASIRQRQKKAEEDDEVSEWTSDMLKHLGYYLQRRESPVILTPADRKRAESIPWEGYAPEELIRRRMNLTTRLNDFPSDLRRIQPTWLGNVLRAYEDQTGREPVETFVLEVLDRLPPSLRTQHDEHRNQLDLYCSMVFVAALITIFATARLSLNHWPYAIIAVFVGALGMWLAYWAAIASARIYGIVLLTIAQRFPKSAK